MPITPEFAGLVAQVFPALFIAVLIEGRLRTHHVRTFWLGLFMIVVRFISLAGAALSTFLCLLVVGGAETLANAEPVLVLVHLSGLGLALTLSMALGQYVGLELIDLLRAGVPERAPGVLHMAASRFKKADR